MEKENVLKEALNETERDGKETVIKDGVEKNGSAVLGKFKDENALLSAYGALEAEFTRRSQRLKALERELSMMKAEKPEKDGVGESGLNGVKTESVAITKEEFVEPANESLVGDERGEKESLESVVDGFALDGAKPVEAVAKVFGAGSVAQSVSDQEIYERASGSEEIRLKIIGDYFESLKKSGAPLVRGGQGTIATPSVRPVSVSQAGDMALSYFKNEKSKK